MQNPRQVRKEKSVENMLANMSPEQLAALEVRAEPISRPRRPSVVRGMAQKSGEPASHTILTEAEEKLMELGREELLMREAEVFKEIVVKANNKDRVGLTSVELSYLHQQLQGIMTTCTLIIGFAMAALSADLLVEFGSEESQFCLYKSVPSTVLATIFITLDTTCICVCFTVIAAVQIIIFQSQRAIFSRSMVHKVESIIERTRPRRHVRRVNLTPRVVRMTQLLMYGDRSSNWEKGGKAASKSGRSGFSGLPLGGMSIYVGMGVALTCFFFATIILIWIFLSPLAAWRHMPSGSRATALDGLVPSGGGANSTNSHLIRTHGGAWRARCLDPHDDRDQHTRFWMGSLLSGVTTLVFLANVVFGYWLGRATMKRYSLGSLLELPDEEMELVDSRGKVAYQDLEELQPTDADLQTSSIGNLHEHSGAMAV